MAGINWFQIIGKCGNPETQVKSVQVNIENIEDIVPIRESA